MILGIGSDIVQIPRIARIVSIYGDKFIKRILSTEEIKKTTKLNELSKVNFLAKRFAAKEAISKALGRGIGALAFRDISVLNDDLGKPLVILCPIKAEMLAIMDVVISVSISDDYPVCIAFALASKGSAA